MSTTNNAETVHISAIPEFLGYFCPYRLRSPLLCPIHGQTYCHSPSPLYFRVMMENSISPREIELSVDKLSEVVQSQWNLLTSLLYCPGLKLSSSINEQIVDYAIDKFVATEVVLFELEETIAFMQTAISLRELRGRNSVAEQNENLMTLYSVFVEATRRKDRLQLELLQLSSVFQTFDVPARMGERKDIWTTLQPHYERSLRSKFTATNIKEKLQKQKELAASSELWRLINDQE